MSSLRAQEKTPHDIQRNPAESAQRCTEAEFSYCHYKGDALLAPYFSGDQSETPSACDN